MSGSARLPLSLLVLTCNEELNIARCLDSVPFADEKLVIDCGSSDATLEIAQAHGARVVTQSWLGFGPQRRFATAQARHPWILFLDADEWLSAELQRELEGRVPAPHGLVHGRAHALVSTPGPRAHRAHLSP